MNTSTPHWRVEIEAQKYGAMVFRNNSGAFQSPDGRVVRFGLGNISKAINKRIKSADFIGWDSSGRFLAIEQKPAGWVYRANDEHATAQLRFLLLAQLSGGTGTWATCPADIEAALKRKE